MSNNEFKIRFYQEGDETQIIKLFEKVYKKQITLDWWKWRYLRNPCDKPQIALAFLGEQLVSHYAVSPVLLSKRNQLVKCALSMTTMTHPSFEGKGLFITLASALYKKLTAEGYQFVFGFPNHNSHGIFNNKLAWKDIGIIVTLRNEFKNMTFNDKHITAPKILPFDYSLLRFSQSKNLKIGLAKSDAFFRWRFSKDSGNQYQFLSSRSGAFLIFKEYKSYSLDVVHMEGAAEDLQLLYGQICKYAELNGFSYVETWCSLHTRMHGKLERLGFKLTGWSTFLGGIDFSGSDSFFDLRDWQINMSLSDLY